MDDLKIRCKVCSTVVENLARLGLLEMAPVKSDVSTGFSVGEGDCWALGYLVRYQVPYQVLTVLVPGTIVEKFKIVLDFYYGIV